MFEGADHRDEVAVVFVELVQIPEIHVQQRIAVGEEEGGADLVFQQAEPAAGAHEHVLVGKMDGVVLLQF